MAVFTLALVSFVALFSAAISQDTSIILDEVVYETFHGDFIGKAHSIPKLWTETLVECHVIFPNGVIYEAYPNNNLPAGSSVSFIYAVQPFTSCGVQIRPITHSEAGTYELYSFVEHEDLSISRTSQKFTLNVKDL